MLAESVPLTSLILTPRCPIEIDLFGNPFWKAFRRTSFSFPKPVSIKSKKKYGRWGGHYVVYMIPYANVVVRALWSLYLWVKVIARTVLIMDESNYWLMPQNCEGWKWIMKFRLWAILGKINLGTGQNGWHWDPSSSWDGWWTRTKQQRKVSIWDL